MQQKEDRPSALEDRLLLWKSGQHLSVSLDGYFQLPLLILIYLLGICSHVDMEPIDLVEKQVEISSTGW